MAASRARRLSVIFAAALPLLALWAGCQKRPLDETISASNELGFSLWVSDHAGDLSAAQRQELAEAHRQIKLAVMTDSPGLKAADFAAAVYAEIHGHTVRDVLLRSLAIQSERITGEITALESREAHYRLVDASKLDAAAREFLDDFNARMTRRRADLQALAQRRDLLQAP